MGSDLWPHFDHHTLISFLLFLHHTIFSDYLGISHNVTWLHSPPSPPKSTLYLCDLLYKKKEGEENKKKYTKSNLPCPYTHRSMVKNPVVRPKNIRLKNNNNKTENLPYATLLMIFSCLLQSQWYVLGNWHRSTKMCEESNVLRMSDMWEGFSNCGTSVSSSIFTELCDRNSCIFR